MAADVNNLSTIAYESIFANKKSALAFIENPDRLKIDGDKLRQFANGIVEDQKLGIEKYSKVDENFAKTADYSWTDLEKRNQRKILSGC
jgi:hypothetical protein